MDTVRKASVSVVATASSGVVEGHRIHMQLRVNRIALIQEVVFQWHGAGGANGLVYLMDSDLAEATEDQGGSTADFQFLSNPEVICGFHGFMGGNVNNQNLVVDLRPGYAVAGDLTMRAMLEINNTFRRSIQIFYIIKTVSSGDYIKFLKTRI